MTRKLTISKFSTELDLDSFLSLHSESDDESAAVPHRSLDEILNSSDSSTSPSPPSSPLSPQHLQHNDAVSRSSLNRSQSDQSQLLSQRFDQSRANSSSALKPGGYFGDLIRRAPSSSSSRPLPSLFGGVRSNAKPGAALAAAAAASRSIPTPHAAAIKSRRAVSRNRVIDNEDDYHETVSNSSNVDSIGYVAAQPDDKLAESDDFQSAVDSEVSTRNKNSENYSEIFASNSKDVEHGVEVEDTVYDEGLRSSNDLFRDTPSITRSNVELDSVLDPSDRIEDSKLMDVNDSCEMDDWEYDKDKNNLAGEPFDGASLDMGENDELSVATGDTSSVGDVLEAVEERAGKLESETMDKNDEKTSESIMKPLELAEELEKKQASTGLHLEEGAAAQPMKLEGVRREITTLGYFDIDANNSITRTVMSQAFRRDHGSAQVVAVHLNYIAVGTAKGVIAVFPSRYSPHSGDNMDSKILLLGLQGERSYAPVTSMCFNQQGDLLLSGYGDGHITIWDVQRASAAKVITGEHSAPVIHTLFLGQDSQVTRQFKAVTGDSKGHLFLHSSSVVPLLNRFTIKTQCLLDGTRTGIVLSASPLLYDESFGSPSPSSQGNASLTSSSIGNMMGGVVGGDAGWKLFNEGSSPVEEGVVIFVTHQIALVVRLTPNLEIYAQLPKPDGAREGSMPYTAWKCTSQSRPESDAAERVSLLALAWDRKVQVAKLVKSALKVYGTWSLDSAAIGVAWLDAHMLVVLTLTGKLYLFAEDGIVIHQTSFSVDGFGGDDLVSYHTHFLNIYGNPEKAYHNCIAVRGASVYILGPMHLVVSRLLPWKERIQALRSAGDWMGALNMALTLYDGQAHGVIDLPKSVVAVQENIMPYLVELLLSYVDEVFSYISVALCNQIGNVEQQDDLKNGSSSVHHEIKEQFTRVGGVAVEFFVHIHRTDILFDEIFSKFVAVQQRDTFLELLEPYILRDMLRSLRPEIMQALVEHYSSKGWLQRVEQCVLHMDISSLDFNQVVRLCREHGLYGALVYLFNKGLDDFRAPLEELLIASRNSHNQNAATLGYRMLVYLKYCFSGLSFPPGQGALPPERLPSLRTELVQFLLENSSSLSSAVVSTPSSRKTYLNLYHLLELDTEATLDVLRLAFLDDMNPKPDSSSPIVKKKAEEDNIINTNENLLAQNTIDALVQIVGEDVSQTVEPSKIWPSKKDVENLFEFIAYYVSCRKAYVSGSVLNRILEYLTSESNLSASDPPHGSKCLKRREKQVLALLGVVPETDWNLSYVLQLCEKAQFHQVCGFIHAIRNHYLAALDCFMKDADEPIQTFSYIHNTLRQLNDAERSSFESAIMSRIPELIVLSREGTFLLVMDHFRNNIPRILSQLQSCPESLFLYLKTVIEVHLSGTLDFSCLKRVDSVDDFSERVDQLNGLEAYLGIISDFPKFIRNYPVNVTDDMIELYMELLCQYERNSVLKFLKTFDSYRVEQCLQLCQKYEITDATAFLLERVGDVGSALFLTLAQLNDKFVNLDIAVESAISTASLSGSVGTDHNNVLKIKEVDDIHSILNACIGLCQRNTPRLQPEESETLWFKLLDSFSAPLMDSLMDKMVLHEDEDDEVIIKWKISKSHRNAHVLRKLFSYFIKEIVEKMIGYVRLPTIMSKLLSDNGSQEFGDFKITILGMLGTYGFERRILDTAKSLIEDDTYYTMNLLKKGASHGYAPRNLVCCICNCLLTKDSPSSQIRVFNCGHASHLQCEMLAIESANCSLSGCPICMPKKNAQKPRHKSVLVENGLANKVSSGHRRAQGILHPHEDSHDNSYGIQQIPRFEILTNLQKDQRIVQIENMPQLKLAPPAVYHERVKKGPEVVADESSSSSALSKTEKSSKRRQLRELKVPGSSLRFPLKSSIFGKEKIGNKW